MGGGDNKTTTTATAPTNPAVTNTTNNLLGKLDTATNQGTAVFNKSLYPGVGGTTKDAWSAMLGSANNPTYTNGVNGALADYADVAAGNRFGTDDPGYAALRAKAGDDTLRDVNSIFTTSGRFGSGSHVSDATKELGNVYAGMDMQQNQNDIARQQQAASMLPGLFQASTLPSSIQGAVGSAQDADATASRQAENDLFRRQNDSLWDTLGRSSSILNGTAGTAGTTSTTSQPSTPWWQSALGIGLGAL